MRACSHDGCSTVLSMYNRGRFCAVHERAHPSGSGYRDPAPRRPVSAVVQAARVAVSPPPPPMVPKVQPTPVVGHSDENSGASTIVSYLQDGPVSCTGCGRLRLFVFDDGRCGPCHRALVGSVA